MIDVEHLNRAFPKYPKTCMDKGWIYGTWYCPTAWMKTHFYGQFPLTYLKRVLALFPGAKDILHCPSGTLTFENNGVTHTTVDLIRDDQRKPQVLASALSLPFPDNSFDLYVSDPPYSNDDSKKYGTPPFNLKKAMDEAHRVLRPGGYWSLLHVRYPSFRRAKWNFLGLIGVVTGANRTIRLHSIFQKPAL